MSVSIDKQIAFYNWQLKIIDEEWKDYLLSNVIQLFNANKLFIGRIWGYDSKRGVLILKFKSNKFPRLKEPLTISYPKSEIGSASSWDFNYSEFRENYVEQFSDCQPIYFLPNEKNSDDRFIGFKNVSLDFMKHIKNDLDNRTQQIVFLGAEDPPIEYLKSLKEFTIKNPNNAILNYSDGGDKIWTPKYLSGTDNLKNDVIEILDSSEFSIIQGPPGTGKTHLIAEICEYYMRKNKSVCITSLTHKALMEAAIKDGLKEMCSNGFVYKTNISSDEIAIVPNLKEHSITDPIIKGHLLLTTYYTLSKLMQFNKSYYDLLIIEEASQAFLTTIAGFKNLAKKIIVVGDFMQLQPIVKGKNISEGDSTSNDQNIYTLVNGLKTFSLNNNENSYRLVNTYRLTKKAAQQTGVFYNDSLKSQSDELGLSVKSSIDNYFCKEGGNTILYIKNMDEGYSPNNAIGLINRIIKDVLTEYPKLEIAVLATFKETVKSITDYLLKEKTNINGIEINTIDRIQGMTVDLCIYLIPSKNTKYSYEINRFNVATSRAKRGTIIISENLISNDILLPSTIKNFINKTRKIEVA